MSSAASECSVTGIAARGMSYADAARRAIALGGRYDGHELPEDIHAVTKAAAKTIAGLGLMGVAKDVYPRDGDTYSFVAGFAEVEVDVETGSVTLVDYLGVGDVGTVINPRSLVAQIRGGSCLGIAHALHQKIVYDPHYGLALSRRFYQNRPQTILDLPNDMHAVALEIPDPETPVGAKGVGEPPVGAGYGAVLNAIAAAIGVDAFRRAPVTSDIVLMSLTHGRADARAAAGAHLGSARSRRGRPLAFRGSRPARAGRFPQWGRVYSTRVRTCEDHRGRKCNESAAANCVPGSRMHARRRRGLAALCCTGRRSALLHRGFPQWGRVYSTKVRTCEDGRGRKCNRSAAANRVPLSAFAASLWTDRSRGCARQPSVERTQMCRTLSASDRRRCS